MHKQNIHVYIWYVIVFFVTHNTIFAQNAFNKNSTSNISALLPSSKQSQKDIFAKILKRKCNLIKSINILKTDGSIVASMDIHKVVYLKTIIKNSKITNGASMSTPPWNVFLEFIFKDDSRLFAQLIFMQILRVGNTLKAEDYYPSQTTLRELVLDDEKDEMYNWMKSILGPTTKKEYMLDKQSLDLINKSLSK